MRVLLLADARFARREHELIGRLEIGLFDSGCRVLRAVPERVASVQPRSLMPICTYDDSTNRFGRSAAQRQLLAALSGTTPAIQEDPDGALFEIVHALGVDCWKIAARTAYATSSALVIELISEEALRNTGAFERWLARKLPGSDRLIWLTPNARVHAMAKRLHLQSPVHLAPWGVHTPTKPKPARNEKHPYAISVVSSGADQRAVSPMLEALALLGDDRHEFMLFVDAAAIESNHSLWSLANKLNILERVTFVSDMETRRELVLQTDVLAIPELMGELRTVLLDAMAAGMLVVSRRDPLIEATAAEGVARVIDHPRAEDWLGVYREILERPQVLRDFGERARTRVREDRPVHRQIEAILHAYHSLHEPAPIPITEAR